MYLKKPVSLEDAMAYVDEFENFEKLYAQFYEPRVKHNNNNNNNNVQTNQIRNNINNQYSNYNSFYRQYYDNNYNRNNYENNQRYNNNNNYNNCPSQLINVNPIPQKIQKYPTNAQVFGTRKNVFRPNQIPVNRLPRLEPMSTTSRNFTDRPSRHVKINHNNNNNTSNNRYFQSRNERPNFTSEELYNNNCNNNDEETKEIINFQNLFELEENNDQTVNFRKEHRKKNQK
ncbi:TBC1 domain family member 5 homolog A-like [Diorhabda sublineata]|uniref:TBC1 domain family member 5 homolog A-like n=1 Tax=Diorhabda sublineata TaxID=1163346 RepID=UPI0024E0E317|nr:TBC1 domain family member 5 homolog A-like [Diorhabda sublineata]